jgi:tripartite-type tricarboxylate transporter receptor subunit TctC
LVELNRRSALAGVAAFGAAPKAFAQALPIKPIKIVVPFAAGSTTDLAARGLGAKLQKILKQPVIADDKPGASGQLGASAATPKPIQKALYDAIAEALKDPATGKAMTQGRMEIPPLGLDDFAAYVKAETEWWTKSIKAAGIEPQ